MSATAQQRMKLANEKAMKNINNRGNVPKSTKENPEKYPVTIVSINAVYSNMWDSVVIDSGGKNTVAHSYETESTSPEN